MRISPGVERRRALGDAHERDGERARLHIRDRRWKAAVGGGLQRHDCAVDQRRTLEPDQQRDGNLHTIYGTGEGKRLWAVGASGTMLGSDDTQPST
jgi:hypothetical protein